MLSEKDHPDRVLTTDCVLHYLEIPKIDETVKDDLHAWLYFLRHAGEEDDVMKVLLDTNKPIQAAEQRYELFMADQAARHAYNARQMYLHDEATRLWAAKHEAHVETAKKMKDKGFSINDIIELTDLSKEEIEKL